MLNDFHQFLEFTRDRSLHQARTISSNEIVNQNQHTPTWIHSYDQHNRKESTPNTKCSHPHNDSNESISSAPKQHKVRDNNDHTNRFTGRVGAATTTTTTTTTTTINQQLSASNIPFDQLKRAVSSNLPCFFIDFEQTANTKKPPSAFEIRNLIEQYFKEHNVRIQPFSLVGWSGKRLKLGVNNKEDYVSLVNTENWPNVIDNIPITVTKPKYIPDCFALVVRYVPVELEIEAVRDEIKRTITSADNIKHINYAYARKTNDFRFTVADLSEYNSALKLGRISIGDHWLSVTPFLTGNRMTYCTRCWKIGHIRDQCKTITQRCRVCLQEITKREEHRCSNTAKCAQCDGDHHSLNSQCSVIRNYRAELKEEVKTAIESGKLQRYDNAKQPGFSNKNQDFPAFNEEDKFQQHQRNTWFRNQPEAHRNVDSETTKLLSILNENITLMRESSERVEDKLVKTEAKLNQTALDSTLCVSTLEKWMVNLQVLVEKIIWPIAAQLKPNLVKELEPLLDKMGQIRLTMGTDYNSRRKRAESPPIQSNSSTSKEPINEAVPNTIKPKKK
ncbi:unnamed protein product [Adineta steineri]|uniref:CCHC-type domain-containing protein n=1 Tax=Adineta steineri TaxID=433720 RepID=A0A815W7W8_9BILA|nr:unnamed protein product [Adineta steineri]CAF1541778.1 unnamed protein product [Adineta steineri]